MFFVLILILSVCHICLGDVGVSASTPWWTHFTYVFQHVGWLHLIFNSMAISSCCRILYIYQSRFRSILMAYCIAVAASYLIAYPAPVVGASGASYALIGMVVTRAMRGDLSSYPDKQQRWRLLISVASVLLISFFRANSAGMLHLICLLAGAAIAQIKRARKLS